MAQGSVTSTGMNEMRQAIARLPEAVTAAARRVARNTALRVAAGARARVRVLTGDLQRSITVRPDEANKRYMVTAGRIDGPPIALFLEAGTVKMTAKPFMGPALEAERGSYLSQLASETAKAAEQAFS